MFRPPLNGYIRSFSLDSYASSSQRTNAANQTKKKKKKRFLFKGVTLKDYLNNTSLHGLNLVGSTRITLFERIFFGVAFLVVLFCSVYFISDVYNRWDKQPMIVSFAPKKTYIPNIPFPAVTICNHNKARRSVIHKIANGSTEHAILKSVCYGEYANITNNKGTWNQKIEWSTVRQYLLDISQPCQEMLQSCKFGGETINCMSLFDTVLTDEGLCCSFNSVEPQFLYQNPLNVATNLDNDKLDPRLIPVDWTPDNGYVNESIKRISMPRPALGAGRRLGLYVVLNANVSDYYCSSTKSVGFKVLLHSPIEMPRISYFGMLLHPGRETQVDISPKVTSASYRARKTPLAIRRCIYPGEIQLKFFRTYSRKNCEIECMSQAMEQECGCVMYYMPRSNQSTKICTRANFDCYKPLLISMERGENTKFECSCYSACDSISYSGEVSTTQLIPPHPNAKSLLSNFSAKSIKRDIAVVNFFYTSSGFETYVRDEIFGFTEFLSSTGGLLSLFLGFSAEQDDLKTRRQSFEITPNSSAVQSNPIRPYIRMFNRAYVTGYANNQTVLRRRDYSSFG